MPLVAPSAVVTLSTPPSTSDPTNFDSRADTFLGQLPAFQVGINNLGTVTYTNAQYSQDQATTAAAQASTAAAQATAAANSASAAAAASNAPKWVSGTTYNQGNVVWSPTTFQSYRYKLTTSVSNTDPALDATSWAYIYQNQQAITVTGTSVAMVANVSYLLTNTGGGTNCTLPASGTSTIGDTINIDNATGRSDGLILRNGNLFGGLAEDAFIDIQGPFTIRFYGAAIGWRLL